MRRPGVRSTVVLAALLALAPARPLAAQDARLGRAFEGATLERIQAVVDSAAAEGLPSDPLVLKALEGRSKGAPDDLVVGAVRALRGRLASAAATLGEGADQATLVAAAGALYLGVEPPRLREMAERTDGAALATALVVLGDLVKRGVPVDAAAGSIISLGAAGADAGVLRELRERVDGDIRTGADPGRAMEVRAQGMLVRIRGGGDP